MSIPLRHERTRVPVTALAFAGQYLLAAEGPFLHILDSDGQYRGRSLNIFKTQTIHGLILCGADGTKSELVLAYGGTSLRLISLELDVKDAPGGYSATLGPVSHAPDWILDIVAPYMIGASSTEPLATIAVTAHNGLVSVENEALATSGNASPSARLALSLRELTTSSRCILYSAHLSWLSKEKILIASGTAFGEILVWSCTTTKESNPRSHIHHFFTGHEGSIFGVQISATFSMDASASPRRVLASCSDDRTLRLWDISDLPDHHDLSGGLDALGLIQDRETGFGANVEADSSKCLAVAWGHTSRVWAVRFITGPPTDDNLQTKISRLVSFGEDATSRIWRIAYSSASVDANMTVTVDLIGTAAFHSGKNVWSMALDEMPDEKLRIVTGAADSSIVSHIWPRQNLEYVSPQPSKDAHRSCAFVSKHAFVSATNSGQVMLGDFDSGQIEWREIAQLDDLRGYSTAASIPKLGLVLLAGNSGKIYHWTENSALPEIVMKVDRKVAGLFATQLPGPDGDSRIGLIVTKMGSGVAEFLLLIQDGSSLNVETHKELELPPSFVVTSALTVMYTGRLAMFLGGREGAVAIYDTEEAHNTRSGDSATTIRPPQIVHSPEAVTSLVWIPTDQPSEVLDGHLISVSRDGRVAATQISSHAPPLLVHEISLPFGPNAEGIFVNKSTGNLMAYGFRGKQFVLYDTATEQEVMSVECGGSHRIWAFHPSEAGGSFVWNQAATLKLFSTTDVSHQVIRGGGHGREIKAVAVARWLDTTLIATGAEDTTIRMFRRERQTAGKPDFRCVRVLRRHVTGIQQLEWSDDDEYLFSCGGCEEFYVWRVREIPVIGVGVVCEAVCPPESELPDLRIMSFAVDQRDDTLTNGGAEFIITMVYSDSTLRTYRYSSTPSLKRFQLLEVGTYLTSCLTQCLFLGRTQLLTAGTDGHIAYWATSNKFKEAPLSEPAAITHNTRSKIHQSSIKTLSYTRVSSKTSLLLTGGDDNGIAISLLRTTGNNGTAAPTTSTLLIPRAHAAGITASVVDLLPQRKGQECRVLAVTASNDQRVKVWEIVLDESKPGVEGVRVRRAGNVSTSVADVSSMAVLSDRTMADEVRVVVCGVGMEAWKLDLGQFYLL